MKTLAAFISLLFAQNALAGDLKFTSIDGWHAVQVEKDPVLSVIFSGSDYVLLVDNKEAEAKPVIRVRKLGKANQLKTDNASAWEKIIFGSNTGTKLVYDKKVFKKKGHYQFTAKAQYDTGTPNMLYAVVMGTIVDGEILLMQFEQSRDEFYRDLGAVTKIFHNVEMLAGQ